MNSIKVNSVKIIGTGSYYPSKILTNDDLSKIVDTSDEWIQSRTGIKERRISTGENTSTLAAKAAVDAMEKANIDVSTIDLLILATTSPDSFTPSTASIVQEMIGANNATAFDLSAACSGFLFALNTAEKFVRCNQFKRALVIGAEVLSKIIDWKDRNTCVLFGDAAAAVIIEACEDEGILESYIKSDGRNAFSALNTGTINVRNLYLDDEESDDTSSNYIKMDGKEVFKFAINSIPESINQVLSKSGLNISDIKYIIPHQANIRILEAVAKKLNIPNEKFYTNLDKFGNTSAASIPLALDEINREKLIDKGDYVILVAFGGGFTWGATLLKW